MATRPGLLCGLLPSSLAIRPQSAHPSPTAGRIAAAAGVDILDTLKGTIQQLAALNNLPEKAYDFHAGFMISGAQAAQEALEQSKGQESLQKGLALVCTTPFPALLVEQQEQFQK